jgi:hypothetical protein
MMHEGYLTSTPSRAEADITSIGWKIEGRILSLLRDHALGTGCSITSYALKLPTPTRAQEPVSGLSGDFTVRWSERNDGPRVLKVQLLGLHLGDRPQRHIGGYDVAAR